MNPFISGLLIFDGLIMLGLLWRNCTLADERDAAERIAEAMEIRAAAAECEMLRTNH